MSRTAAPRTGAAENGSEQGENELARLTRTHDWAATPLGPVEAWPQSLKTIVDVVLSSRYSMWMGWGPDLVFLYNDAYARDTLDVKHPWALGRPAREVWSEIWGDLEPRIRTVLETGGATWDEALLLFLARSGYTEETYHTFSYSPLKDDAGRIAGMLCVVTEVTDRVIGERRLALLGTLASRLAATTGESEVFGAVTDALRANSRDLPFALTYLYDEVDRRAHLVSASGIEAGQPAAPLVVDLDDPAAAWPLAEISDGSRVRIIEGIDGRYAGLPTGAWDQPPKAAVAVRIARRGQEAPAGFLVIGLNPYRQFDAAYQDFVDLIAGQIASSHANARAYDEERRRVDALAELDRAKTTFFSNVSHEFRTPLTLLLAPVEDVLRRSDLPDAIRAEVEVAHRNGLRLLKLVNSLLDFSRIEAGRVQASYEPTDLGVFTSEVASGFQSLCERAGLSLTVNVVPMPDSVYVDRDMWEKVVLNLLSNAFKHTFEGGITVTVRKERDAAELVVEDTGIGISSADLPSLFERFHRVPNARSRTHEGTGIGLALVQEIVRRHGGSIDVESEVGRGTRFTVRVPFGYRHLPPEQVARHSDPSSGHQDVRLRVAAAYVEEAVRWLPPEAPLPGRHDQPLINATSTGNTDARGRVVFADDNADMRAYVTRLLEQQGWEVDAHADGLSALEAVRSTRPDLVLSDIMMPGLDGLALLKTLRADGDTAAIPVVLLSARAGEEARVEGAVAAADDYIVKPFSAPELLARLGTQLTRARERARAEESLRAARDQLTSVLEQAPVGICVLRGAEHVYELANAFYRRFLPAGRDIIGRSVREVVPEAEAFGFVALLDAVRNTGAPWIGRDVEFVYDRHGTGRPETAFLNILYYPLYNDAREIEGVIAVVAEVTDEVRARREADDARRAAESAKADADAARGAAEAANAAKSDFLAVMSHELRTPLNAIGGYVELIEMGIHGPVTTAQEEALRRIGRAQRHLLGLINDVLNLARIETGRLDYSIETVDLAIAFSELATMVDPQLAAKHLEFETTGGPPFPKVRADREKLMQVLLNLLSNAIKFTPPGGRITASVFEAAPDVVHVRVSDTGNGIPHDKLEAIFEPFVQVRGERGRSDGAGLGLAISRDLARGMGGDLGVESVERQGSTFTLTLPRNTQQGE